MSEQTYRNGILVEPREGYNGWTNYPTWAVKLWIDNDEGSYNYWREQVGEAQWRTNDPTDPDFSRPAVAVLAERIKAEHEQGVERYDELGLADIFSDLMGYALGCVNWHEIAESLISEVREA